MNSPRRQDASRLLCIANEIAAATASYATAPGLQPVQRFLQEVREALGMDVAFISQFVADRVRFEVVVSAGSELQAIAAGESSRLVDTYCKLIVDGELPEVIRDVADFPEAQRLPATARLNIGSYLSVRVVLENGEVFGTVCCLSHEPRPDLDEADAAALRAVAAAIAGAVQRDGSIRDPISR